MTAQGTVFDVVMHPVRLRILQAITGRELTTARLREALPDIAQATLYRHVAALVESGFLSVVHERPARGAVERTYALGERLAHVDSAELSTLSDEQLEAAFLAFIRELTRSFETVRGLGAAYREQLGFGTTALYLDDRDLSALQQDFAELIEPYMGDGPGRQRFLLSTVVLPAPEDSRANRRPTEDGGPSPRP